MLANGNVTSARSAVRIVEETGAAGIMIGRHAIRNPWIFGQCRDAFAGRPVAPKTLSQVFDYIVRLYETTTTPGIPETARVNRMKKFLNFVGQGVDGEGRFLYEMRRTRTAEELFTVCRENLLARPDALFADEPFPGVIARPNCETPLN